VEHLKDASLGQALALSTNISIGWKGLPGTNPIAYYKELQIMDIKRFITLGFGRKVIKIFCP
jgi:hypothetical protein